MSRMSKNQLAAVRAYYKAMHEENNFADLTIEMVAELLTKRLGFNVSKTSAREIRIDFGLPTKKRCKKATPKSVNIDNVNAVRMLAKTQMQLIHVIISLLNRNDGYDKTTKDSMLCNLDSMASRTRQQMNFTGKTRKPCILPHGYPTRLGRKLREAGKTDEEIIGILKTEYIKVGVEGWKAIDKARCIVNHKLDLKKEKKVNDKSS